MTGNASQNPTLYIQHGSYWDYGMHRNYREGKVKIRQYNGGKVFKSVHCTSSSFVGNYRYVLYCRSCVVPAFGIFSISNYSDTLRL